MAHIDPIAVKEELKRLQEHADAMTAGAHAAKALLWFKEYATDREAALVLTLRAELVAGSTPDVEAARSFVTHATEAFAQKILDQAIATARHRFDHAERTRRVSAKALSREGGAA